MTTTAVIIGHAADSTTTHLRAVAATDTLDIRFVDLGDLHRRGAITESDAGTVISIGKQRHRLDRGTAVFQRMVAPERHHFDSSEAFLCALMANTALTAVLCNHPGIVVNGVGAGWHNSAKMFHLILLAAQGFDVPRSLCSADPEAVSDFVSRTGRAIYKSNSGRRSIVSEVTQEIMRSRGRFLFRTPVLFQELICGDDIRVHIVGDDAFAVRAISSAVDYRYAKRSGDKVEMQALKSFPDDLLAKCHAFCAGNGLHIAGFDFKLATDRYVCLEANPSPAFESYDHVLDGVIARAVLSLLRKQSNPVQTPGIIA
jgi:glutathione synthase/RimK-type ligase-like ATP-grasp enzyme